MATEVPATPCPAKLHYRGDKTDYDTKLIYGPDMDYNYAQVVCAEYDAEYMWPDGMLGRTTHFTKLLTEADLDAIRAEDAEVKLRPLYQGWSGSSCDMPSMRRL